MRFSSTSTGLLAATALALAACSNAPAEDGEGGAAVSDRQGAPQLCAAVRGNGQSILTHFASLSQIVSHYGVVDAMAGGSSGSITTFIYESMLKNPVIKRDRARLALALKSVEGYADAVGESDEADVVKGFATAISALKKSYEEKGIDALASTEVVKAAELLTEVLSIREVRGMVNPELFNMLKDSSNLAFNVSEIKTSITQLGAFSVDDNRLFFREGVLNWSALAPLFGRVGDFYAGYGRGAGFNRGQLGSWLEACAYKTQDLPWSEAAKITIDGGTCGSVFTGLVEGFRKEARATNYSSRIDERVGDAKSPLRKLISTAVIEGDAVKAYEAALEPYKNGAFKTGSVPFHPEFGDVNFGYWGSQSDLELVKRNTKGYTDLKTKKFSSLGSDATWRQVLAASPAEPGLSRFVALSDGRYSGGGWSDLAPALVLKNIGCQQVIYVTREGDESNFATKIAKQAGMSSTDWSALYDLENETSSYAFSVKTADGVWCTNWNGFKDSEMPAEVLDSFSAPFEVRASFIPGDQSRAYKRTVSRTGKPGCTPGVGGGAKAP